MVPDSPVNRFERKFVEQHTMDTHTRTHTHTHTHELTHTGTSKAVPLRGAVPTQTKFKNPLDLHESKKTKKQQPEGRHSRHADQCCGEPLDEKQSGNKPAR